MHATPLTWGASLGAYGGAASVSLGLGYVLAREWLPEPVLAGELVLALTIGGVLTAQRRRSLGLLVQAGAGVRIAAFGLAVAFLVGLLVSDDSLGHKSTVAFSFSLGVVALLAGAALSVAVFGGYAGPPRETVAVDVFRLPLVVFVGGALLAVAVINLATGAVPLLAGNVDTARFGGNPGALGQLWAWAIGGIEWLLVCAGIRVLWMSRIDCRGMAVILIGSAVLVLLAGRSFFVLVALALVVALATFGRLPARRLIMLSVAGMVALGIAGDARLAKSEAADPELGRSTTTGRIVGQVSHSAAIGPAVYATLLDQIPQHEPFQHGRFLFRDLRAGLPLHPLGEPARGDIWFTEHVRGRDPSVVGGSPPTLVGGFYVDFGFPGIIAGCALLGVILSLLGRWANRRGTAGALALYGYTSAYVALASYSYFSFRPALVAVVLLSLLLHRAEMSRRRPSDDRARSLGQSPTPTSSFGSTTRAELPSLFRGA